IPGGSVVLTLTRINIAERLYRITGEGIYCHSMLLGRSVPTVNPGLNAGVMGQDTVLAVPYQGKIFWFWGDTWGTNSFNFAVAGAMSQRPDQGGLDPDIGVNLDYFVDTRGFPKPICPDFGSGRVWLDWVATVMDDQKQERLVARYSRVKSLDEIIESGFAVYNDKQNIFEPVAVLPAKTSHLSCHPFVGRVNGQDYVYFTAGFQFSRVRATLTSMIDPLKYEYFGCFNKNIKEHCATGHPHFSPNQTRTVYCWKRNEDGINAKRSKAQATAEQPAEKPKWIHLRNIETGFIVDARPGSIFWNRFREKWIMIAQENIGQIWFSEADTPVGPWVYAQKVVSHSDYNFYNPTHHLFFDQQNGRIIYFEGTYTQLFLNDTHKTPRYDYNQIMYRLDLMDSRLFLPRPVYRVHDNTGHTRYVLREGLKRPISQNTIDSIDFFAMQPNRTPVGLIPVFAGFDQGIFRFYTTSDRNHVRSGPALFYALPTQLITPDQQLEGIWQCTATDVYDLRRPFVLSFNRTGNILKASASPSVLTIMKIQSSDMTIDLTLRHQQIDYHLHAEFGQGRLTGTWHRWDMAENGTWEGTRVDFVWKQMNALSVVPLFEYWNQTACCYIYSTRFNIGNCALTRSASPVCRVWKNPMRDLVLDYETEPMT
ncbi:MAG: hypothetical protein WA151_13665, partial [Desulfatirhabdiaceae bacterium]